MKRLLCPSVLILTLIATLLLVAGPVAAKATKTEFTATELYVEDLSPGKEWYTGKDGKNYYVRGSQMRFTVETTDLRVSGDEIITANDNFKLVDPPVYLIGRMWGTFYLTNEDGSWEGTWTGMREVI